MSKFIGRLSDVGVARESSRGTGVAPALWLPKIENNFYPRVTKQRTQASYGTINQDGYQSYMVQKWSEGSLVLELEDKALGYFLYALLGTCNSSGPVDSAYTHAFTLQNDNQHDSLSITVKESDIATVIYTMAMINSLKIEANTGEIAKLTVDLISKMEKDTNAVTPSYSAQNKFVARNFSLKLADNTAGLGTASVIRPKSFSLTVNKNAKPDFGLGTADPVDIYNQAISIEGEIELNYADETYKDLMLNGTFKAMRVAFTSDALIGNSSVPSFTLDLSRCDFDVWEPARPNDELATQKIQFRALYDVTNGNVINACTLVNGQASY